MITLISLQKNGAAPKDSLEISNALQRNNIEHNIIISDELEDYLVKSFKTKNIIKIKTYKSKVSNFILTTFFTTHLFKLISSIKNCENRFLFLTHFHPWLLFIFIFNNTLLKKNKLTIIYGIHENPYKPKESHSVIINYLEKYYIKKSNYIFSHSKFLALDLINDNIKIKDKLLITPLGSYHSLNPSNKRTLNNFSEELTVSFIGRIEEYKGIDLLLNSYLKIKNEGLKIKLKIAGNGKINKKTSGLLKNLNIELYNNWLSDQEINNILKKTHILIVPYYKATQSGVISMGMAFGVPTIASNTGGLPEQIKESETGFIFEVGNYKSLTEKIVYLYKNRHVLNDMSKKCLELNSSNDYNWQKTSYYIDKILKKDTF